MIIGIPREIKKDEYRVGIVPAGVRALITAGHTILLEKDAGLGSGITNDEFAHSGADIVDSPAEIFARSDIVMKVKEPLPAEYGFLRPGLIIYTYFHLAAVPELADILVEKGVTAVAYETVQLESGELPLLTPMSEIAGRMSIQEGAKYLEKENHGRGILLSGVPGIAPGKISILGGGTVGTNAAKLALGLGAQVTILDTNLHRLRYLDDIFHGRARLLMSDTHNQVEAVTEADLVIGAVLIAGARAPRIVTREMISAMKPGAVIVDVSIDQGGCVETARPTSHTDPTYIVDDVVHYCVSNMPGAVPRSATYALTNATLPYVKLMADAGLEESMRRSAPLAHGLNVHKGKITHPGVADALGRKFEPARF